MAPVDSPSAEIGLRLDSHMTPAKESLTWTPERQIEYPLISETSLSPDGLWLVYVVREPVMTVERSEEITHLHLSEVLTGRSRQFTYGHYSNRLPRWSPDGRHIAFVSDRSGRGNVYVMRRDGGEARAVTAYDNSDVVGLSWSPDGRSIAFLMSEPPTEERLQKDEAKDDPILFDQEFKYAHLHRLGFSDDSSAAADVEQVTSGAFHVQAFDWLHDGSALAIVHRPTPVDDDWPLSRLATIPAKPASDSEPNGLDQLTDLGPVSDYQPVVKVSPDGAWIACAAGDQPIRWAFSNRIVLYPTGGGEPVHLDATPDGQSLLLGWSKNSDELYVFDAAGTSTHLWALPVSGERRRLLDDGATLKGFGSVSRSGLVAFTEQDFRMPNSVSLHVPETGESRTVAAPSMPTDWPGTKLPSAEVVRWRSSDGQEIEGVLIYPAAYVAGEAYPLIVHVHGGPTGIFARQYLATPDGFCDAAGLAERGCFVLRPNPRGSSGYGKAFRHANYGDWGGGDYRDIMSGVELLIEQGKADPERLGIMGWSYGGYMTSWVITQTDRFKAACVGAGVTNLMSFNGTADIPGFIPDYFGGEYWEDLEPYRRHSAMFQLKGVSTPTLVLHGADDIRVPLSQGRELYNGLKRQGVPAEMVIYPRQGHSFVEPRHKIDVRKRALAWFERWILSPERSDP